MYSAHNEGKSAVVERFIKTFKNKIYKHMTSIPKNVHLDKLDNMVNEYNIAYHRAIKMKSNDVNNYIYIYNIYIVSLMKKLLINTQI